MNGIWVIFAKEAVDNLRDRRTLTTIAFSVLLFPIMFLGSIWFLGEQVRERFSPVSAESVPLPVVGAERAPNLMAWLAQHHIEVLPPPADPEQAVSRGSHRLVLVVEEGYAESLQAGEPAPLRLIHDSSSSNLHSNYGRVRGILFDYSDRLSNLRLLARGVDPGLTSALAVNTSDVSPPQSGAAELMFVIPYILILSALFGGFYLAIDSTSGERERGSLEPLLSQPVPRWQILTAKLAACCLFSAATLVFSVTALALSFAQVPLDDLGLSLSFHLWQWAVIILGCLPFVLFGCALLMLCASFTKTYKEAQSYLGFAILVPTLPAFFTTFVPGPDWSNMWIPSLSQALIIAETLKGRPPAPALMALSACCTLVLGAVTAWVAVKLYERESILT